MLYFSPFFVVGTKVRGKAWRHTEAYTCKISYHRPLRA